MTSAQGQAYEEAIARRPAYINVPTPFGGHPWPGQPAGELADPAYESVPRELYDYVEHLKRVWPERHRFELKISVPEKLKVENPPGWLDEIERGMSVQMHDEMRKRHHVVISIDSPEWWRDRACGLFMIWRVVSGWSVPAPDGVKFG